MGLRGAQLQPEGWPPRPGLVVSVHAEPQSRVPRLHSHVTWGADTRTLRGTLGTQWMTRSGDEGLLRGRPPSTLGSQGLLRDYSFGCPLSTQEKAATFPSSQLRLHKAYVLLGSVLGARQCPAVWALRGSLSRERENKRLSTVSMMGEGAEIRTGSERGKYWLGFPETMQLFLESPRAIRQKLGRAGSGV